LKFNNANSLWYYNFIMENILLGTNSYFITIENTLKKKLTINSINMNKINCSFSILHKIFSDSNTETESEQKLKASIH